MRRVIHFNPPASAAPVGWHILLVDDEKDIRDSLSQLLGLAFPEARISTAGSGGEALHILEQELIDVVVSDFRMPGMDGLELLQRVRDEWPDVTRIILSAYGIEDLEEAQMLEQVANAIYAKTEATTRLMADLAACRDVGAES